MNFGQSKLQWEQFFIVFMITAGVSSAFFVVLNSALSYDDRLLSHLRKNYRERIRDAKKKVRSVRGSGSSFYNQVSTNEPRENIDPSAPLKREVYWKKIQGDVFRKPSCSFLLSVLVGAGVQIWCVLYLVILASFYDLYSPFDKGILIGLGVGIFPFFGMFNGYSAARFYTFFNGSDWFTLAGATSIFLPLLILVSLGVIEFMEFAETQMLKNLPFADLNLLMIYWLLLQLPSTFFGTYMGCYQEKIKAPTKVNRSPRL